MNDLEYESWKARRAAFKAERRRRNRPATNTLTASLWDSVGPPIRWQDLTPQWQKYLNQVLAAYIELDLAPVHAWDQKNQAAFPRDYPWANAVTEMCLASDRL